MPLLLKTFEKRFIDTSWPSYLSGFSIWMESLPIILKISDNYRKSNHSCSKIYNSCSDKDLLILSSLCPFHKMPLPSVPICLYWKYADVNPFFWVFRENKHHQVIHQKCLKHLQSNLTVSTFSPPPCWATRQSFHDEPEPWPKKKNSKFLPWWEKIFHMLTKICKTVVFTCQCVYIYKYGRPPPKI